MSVLVTIIVLSILILVHEWGHFIAARRVGIPVYEFSLGFGYRLLHYEKNGVVYSLRIFPIGGFVQMAGEQPDDLNNPDGFNNRTPLEKMRVAFAGPLMNFILPIFIFIYSYAFIGIPTPVKEVVIGGVIAGQPAAQAGLKENDHVLSINGRTVKTWDEFTNTIKKSYHKSLRLKISREGTIIYKTVTPQITKQSNVPKIGAYSQVHYEKQGIVNSVKFGFIKTYDFTVLMIQSLGMLFTGAASASDLAGPVGITMMVGEAAQGGILYLLAFVAFLSVNLGVINLLPIPALDGSRIMFAAVESIRKKPIAPEKEGFIHWLGFMFLMLLIVLVTYNDIVRLIKG
ncbi:MAG TPA: RIP metalloprotease RseP [Syntrophomonadaceae bacterium]|nr:RIP metalloprotease RseP [Syntrophomonadaceae bacterium]